ncbi:hypothetical protein MTP10_40935 [Nonomuraea sp. 3-1Str]|uniref:hypothetical protein n=1 Tax=Nonomuraea sp. 3-1Str TaxID=2929801 RepID=UPI00285AA012|nr:hypothetical protein [Nonomuraea sp. 3-1Str]MDR8415084.1 hypothetical protein [Nonomuraea sp. 3-1Str]
MTPPMAAVAPVVRTERDQAALLASEYAELLAAARASVAAAALGEGDPLIHVRHVLARHGQLPPAGARPVVLLAHPAITSTRANRAGVA